ncbi:D-3-phosphoglycerate dehydrogenase 3, chloroplastic-like [Selaginella moellendorffii]|uniref:D-3-phosphoglycerate dehydrogenase 3, chloroplastic-like n=1 Tax=Selaginella moellendorffii TaxID=88036 RepID=UPI000D1CA56A|nr:D-3-phosphoglycerate dehydrogenase 3, chloroplastic-like [Selaginella moellendorffii]|eukprot:XP_024526903.1 D-3-phosphoglycerate dehydrogenase 3, chloroplastic-like [Selaginella moellendorffii]
MRNAAKLPHISGAQPLESIVVKISNVESTFTGWWWAGSRMGFHTSCRSGSLALRLEGSVILCKQVDQPGIIGKAGGLLSVNVSFMSVGMTSPRKQAVRAIGVDEEGSAAQDPGHPNGRKLPSITG